MANSDQGQTVAIAGLLQVIEQVKAIAWGNVTSNDVIETAIHTVLVLDAPDNISVYGNVSNIRRGLKLIEDELAIIADPEIQSITLNTLKLARQILKKPELYNKIRSGIETIKKQAEFFNETHSNVIHAMGELYQENISPLSPKIMVHGNPEILQNSDTIAKIRSLLFAAIRSAVLWYQNGGSRFNLVLKRNRYLAIARELRSLH